MLNKFCYILEVIIILVGIAGITGIGKSFYKDKLVEELGFEKVKILTTREARIGEKNNEDKRFLTVQELNSLEEQGEIAYRFEFLGASYAYKKDEIYSNKNMVFEMHYSTIKDFKIICKTIYLFPKDVNISKQMLKDRNLKPEVEKKRLNEIDQHLEYVKNNKKLLNLFDYILYNNYDEESKDEVINIVKNMIKKE